MEPSSFLIFVATFQFTRLVSLVTSNLKKKNIRDGDSTTLYIHCLHCVSLATSNLKQHHWQHTFFAQTSKRIQKLFSFGSDLIGLDGMGSDRIILCHRSSKSTFGANKKVTLCHVCRASKIKYLNLSDTCCTRCQNFASSLSKLHS